MSSQPVQHERQESKPSQNCLDYSVVRGGIQEGLLMLTLPVQFASANPATTLPALARGMTVQHGGMQWICVFPIDQYWFAVPVDGGKLEAQWYGQSDERSELRRSDAEVEAIAHCLRQATPTQAERAQLSDAISTGISAVDVLAPVGRGQSMLICGGSASGKSTLACDIIEKLLALNSFDKVIRFSKDLSASPSDVVADDRPEAIGHAERRGYAEISVVAGTDTTSASCLLGPFLSAIAAAESSRDAGGHAVLVLDTLAPMVDSWDLGLRWAEASRGCSLEQESISGQRRSFFSNIFERAANLKCGGSLTLLGLVDTDAFTAVGPSVDAMSLDRAASKLQGCYVLADFAGRKESDLERIKRLEERGVSLTDKTLAAIGIAPPAHRMQKSEHSVAMRELQSLSDGQIVLDQAMAKTGAFPAVVPGTTFSRFGLGSTNPQPGAASVQRDVRPTALQGVAAHLRMELALENDARFREVGSDADVAQSTRMEAVKATLLQGRHTHLQTEEMVALLLAACSGAFDRLPHEKAVASLRGGSSSPFIQYLNSSAPLLLQRLKGDDRIPKELASELDVSIRCFVALQAAS